MRMGTMGLATGAVAETVDQIADAALEEGLPVPDHISMMPTSVEDDRVALARKLISDLKPGLTHFVLYPTRDTPEARTITPSWAYRVGDYETFTTKELKDHLKGEGIQLIDYKDLTSAMRCKNADSISNGNTR